LSLQHLVEAKLILHSYCETVHLRAHVLQKLISGINPFAKIFIDFQLISDNIFERGLILVEILPIIALLADVEGEIRLIPSQIEALIQMKTIVGVPNKVDILMDHRAIDTHMARPEFPRKSHVIRALTILR
jgi:hypothetical protein